jgi:hypothetical protein
MFRWAKQGLLRGDFTALQRPSDADPQRLSRLLERGFVRQSKSGMKRTFRGWIALKLRTIERRFSD